jgi:hypothetical protein
MHGSIVSMPGYIKNPLLVSPTAFLLCFPIYMSCVIILLLICMVVRWMRYYGTGNDHEASSSCWVIISGCNSGWVPRLVGCASQQGCYVGAKYWQVPMTSTTTNEANASSLYVLQVTRGPRLQWIELNVSQPSHFDHMQKTHGWLVEKDVSPSVDNETSPPLTHFSTTCIACTTTVNNMDGLIGWICQGCEVSWIARTISMYPYHSVMVYHLPHLHE